MFVQKSGRVDDWTCLKSSCQKLLLLFNCGFDSTLHWIKQIRYCFSENARPSLKILWPTQLWVSQWKTHKCRKNTKTIIDTGMTFLPAISQTGAKTAVEIFWSFSNKKQCFMIASLNILRCAAMKCNVLRHCTVKSKKLVWTWLRKGLLSPPCDGATFPSGLLS